MSYGVDLFEIKNNNFTTGFSVEKIDTIIANISIYLLLWGILLFTLIFTELYLGLFVRNFGFLG